MKLLNRSPTVGADDGDDGDDGDDADDGVDADDGNESTQQLAEESKLLESMLLESMLHVDSNAETSSTPAPANLLECENDQKVTMNSILPDVDGKADGAKKITGRSIDNAKITQSASLPDVEIDDELREEIRITVCNPSSSDATPANPLSEIFPDDSSQSSSTLRPTSSEELKEPDKVVNNLSETVKDSPTARRSPCKTRSISVVRNLVDPPLPLIMTSDESKLPLTEKDKAVAATVKVVENGLILPTSAIEVVQNGVDPARFLDTINEHCRIECLTVPVPVKVTEIGCNAHLPDLTDEGANCNPELNHSEKDHSAIASVAEMGKAVDPAVELQDNSPSLVEEDLLKDTERIVDHMDRNPEKIAENRRPSSGAAEEELVEKGSFLRQKLATAKNARSGDTNITDDAEVKDVETVLEVANIWDPASSVQQLETKEDLSRIAQNSHIESERNVDDLLLTSTSPDVDPRVKFVEKVDNLTDTARSTSSSDSLETNSTQKSVDGGRNVDVPDPVQSEPCSSENEQSAQSSVIDPESKLVDESQSKSHSNFLSTSPVSLDEPEETRNIDSANDRCTNSNDSDVTISYPISIASEDSEDAAAPSAEATSISLAGDSDAIDDLKDSDPKTTVSIFDPAKNAEDPNSDLMDSVSKINPVTDSKEPCVSLKIPRDSNVSIFDSLLDFEGTKKSAEDPPTNLENPVANSIPSASKLGLSDSESDEEDPGTNSNATDSLKKTAALENSIPLAAKVSIFDSESEEEDPATNSNSDSLKKPTTLDVSVPPASKVGLSDSDESDEEDPAENVNGPGTKKPTIWEVSIPLVSKVGLSDSDESEEEEDPAKNSQLLKPTTLKVSVPPASKVNVFDPKSGKNDPAKSLKVVVFVPESGKEDPAKNLIAHGYSPEIKSRTREDSIPIDSNKIPDDAINSEVPVKNCDVSERSLKKPNASANSIHLKTKAGSAGNTIHRDSNLMRPDPARDFEDPRSSSSKITLILINKIKAIQNSISLGFFRICFNFDSILQDLFISLIRFYKICLYLIFRDFSQF